MSGNGEQLVSFFVYSLFVYPITNYIVAPQRKYPKWRAAMYAILFLLGVSTLHLMYDSMETGPNHYQLLKVTRDTPVSFIKKAYRSLSLEFHPDKNKDPGAADMFQKIKHAFDVITDKDKKREYNRLGEHGVAVLAQSVVDHKYILIQLIVYYASSLIFAFLMTFSEPTGDAFSICVFGLTAMLFIEMLLVVQETPLPGWFLPDVTPNDLVVAMHRLYPAFMNGCRCITGAFYVDRKAVRVAALDALSNLTKDMTMRVSAVGRALHSQAESRLCAQLGTESNEVDISSDNQSGTDRVGIMQKQLAEARRRVESTQEGRSGALVSIVTNKVVLIRNPAALRKTDTPGGYSFGLLLLRDVSVYLLARFLFIKAKRL